MKLLMHEMINYLKNLNLKIIYIKPLFMNKLNFKWTIINFRVIWYVLVRRMYISKY